MAYDHVTFDKNLAGPEGAWGHGAVLRVGSGEHAVPRHIAEDMVEAGHGAWMTKENGKWVRVANPNPQRRQ